MFKRSTKMKALLLASAVAMFAMTGMDAGAQGRILKPNKPFTGSPRWSSAVPPGVGGTTQPGIGASGVTMTPNPPVVSPTV